MTAFKRQAIPTTTFLPVLRKASKPLTLLLLACVFLTHLQLFYTHLHKESTPTSSVVIILGMHRSSTSLLSGLMITGLGYEMGGPALPAADDNPKGFFERNDVVDMNDAFLNKQNMTWDNHERILGFNLTVVEEHLASSLISMKEFSEIMSSYSGGKGGPYLHKDPRTCLTLPIWMKHLSNRPAILFTYRHPLAVAESLKKRDNFPLFKGLTLWIIYNVLALRYSTGYCRVVTSSDLLLHSTKETMDRISRELTMRCHVVPSRNATVSAEVADSFVDHSLQHNTKWKDDADGQFSNAAKLQDFGSGCVAHKFNSDHAEDSEDYRRESHAHLVAMKLFCAFESGVAFRTDYEFPDLSVLYNPTATK